MRWCSIRVVYFLFLFVLVGVFSFSQSEATQRGSATEKLKLRFTFKKKTHTEPESPRENRSPRSKISPREKISPRSPKSLRFWEKISARSYADELTKKTLDHFLHISADDCIDSFTNNPEAYLRVYGDFFKPIKQIQNETYQALSLEMTQLKRNLKIKKLIPSYLEWLMKVTETLENYKNYDSLTSVLVVVSNEADYWASTGSYREGSLGTHESYFIKVFAEVLNIHNIEKLEARMQEYETLFIPNTANIFRQIHIATSREIGGAIRNPAEILRSICSRIDHKQIENFRIRWGFQ